MLTTWTYKSLCFFMKLIGKNLDLAHNALSSAQSLSVINALFFMSICQNTFNISIVSNINMSNIYQDIDCKKERVKKDLLLVEVSESITYLAIQLTHLV